MKKTFLVLSVVVGLVTAKFLHARIVVEQHFGPSSMLATGLLISALVILLVSYMLVDSSHREKVTAFWLVSVSTIGTYLIVDLSIGAILIEPLSPALVPDEYRHHKLVPDAFAKFEQRDFSYVQRNNSLGLRGKEFDAEKVGATYRILMLGDSFTMGKGVEDDQTFTALLETRLNSRLSTCNSEIERVDVLNGGVDSYSPLLSYLYLSRELIRLNPDLVILNLDNSDLVQEAAYRGNAVRDESGMIIAVPGQRRKELASTRFRNWIENNLYMTRLILFHVNQQLGYTDLTVRGVVSRANRDVILHTLQADRLDRSRQWNDILESVVRIRDFAESHSAEFVISIYPWAHQVSDDEWTPGRFTFLEKSDTAKEQYDEGLAETFARADIKVINTYRAFGEHVPDVQLYFDYDPHFTVQGHQLMANELAKQLGDIEISDRLCQTDNVDY